MLKYILTALLLVPDVASAGNFLDRLGISPRAAQQGNR